MSGSITWPLGNRRMSLINFTATDSHGASTQFTDSIDVNGVNDNPIAMDDGFATDEKTAVGGSLFADNGHGADTDPDDGDSFTVTAVNGTAVSDGDVVSLDSGAEVTIHANGTFSYDPNGAFDLSSGELGKRSVHLHRHRYPGRHGHGHCDGRGSGS